MRRLVAGVCLGLLAVGSVVAQDVPGPAEKMAEPEVEAALRAVLGQDFDAYAAMLSEPGQGKAIGVDYYGSTCLKGDCDAGYATLFVDSATGEVYAAWTDGGNLHFRPALESWSEAAEMAYEFWPEN